jgi:hypothetical protein
MSTSISPEPRTVPGRETVFPIGFIGHGKENGVMLTALGSC